VAASGDGQHPHDLSPVALQRLLHCGTGFTSAVMATTHHFVDASHGAMLCAHDMLDRRLGLGAASLRALAAATPCASRDFSEMTFLGSKTSGRSTFASAQFILATSTFFCCLQRRLRASTTLATCQRSQGRHCRLHFASQRNSTGEAAAASSGVDLAWDLPPSVKQVGYGAAGVRFVWEWEPGECVHFERAPAPTATCSSTYAVVMVHGFGADSGYFSAQLGAIADAKGVAYAIDLFGQGRSWPAEDPTCNASSSVGAGQEVDSAAEEEEWGWGSSIQSSFRNDIAFGEPTWLEQVARFLQEVVVEKDVYLLGNSLGGYLAAKVAALDVGRQGNSSRIRGLILANATPFWGWTREGFAPWDGRLPAPFWVKPLATLWFAALRANIGPMLRLVYAAPENEDVSVDLLALAHRIEDSSAHPMGASAFASILFAPQQSPSFGDALDSLAEHRLPMLLLYGNDDPWIVPWWAERAAQRIAAAGGEYYAMSPAGHCPHHEAPAAFNHMLLRWLSRCRARSVSCSISEQDDDLEVLAVGDRIKLSARMKASDVRPNSDQVDANTCSVVIERRL